MQSSCLDSLNFVAIVVAYTLPNDENLGQGKAVLRAFQDTDVKGVMLSLVNNNNNNNNTLLHPIIYKK